MDLEAQRLHYDLTADSIVLDAGAYEGRFTREINQKYNCHVYAFEPVRAFYNKIRQLETNPKIRVFNYGLGAVTERAEMTVRNDSSSLFLGGDVREWVSIKSVSDAMRELILGEVDLFKVNIEGAEYDLLDHLLNTGLVSRFRYVQVQFHLYGALAPQARRDGIRARLSATHEESWCYPFVWESHRRRVSSIHD